MLPAVINQNREIIQSYIWTTARYEANAYEKRILYRIIEAIQCEIEGKSLKGWHVETNIFEDRIFKLPIGQFLKDKNDKNYSEIKSAFIKLRNRVIEFDDGETWRVIGLIEKPELNYRGYVQFEVGAQIYGSMLNFAKGYRKYELEVAFSLKSAYTMRLYELLAGQKQPISFNFNNLKEMLVLQNKYKRNYDFVKRIIEPARLELDKKSSVSFTYSATKDIITFFPVIINENKNKNLNYHNLNKQVPVNIVLNKEEITKFKQAGFLEKQLQNNMVLIMDAKKLLPDFALELSILASKSRNKRNPQGWIINALKGKVQDIKNFKNQSDNINYQN